MKRKTSFVIIFIFCFSLIPTSVYAAPQVTNITDQDQNPINWGIYGDIVHVYGDGVTSGSEVKLYWDIVQDWDGEKGLLNTTEAGPDGTFEVIFTVPEAVNGSHYLWLRDSDIPPHTFGPELFSVKSSITLSPEKGQKDDNVRIRGYGFGGEINVDTIEFDENSLTTNPNVPVTDILGSWTATFDVPDKIDGEYNVTAADIFGNSASFIFTIGPTITLDQIQGSVGSIVELAGKGFTTLGTITSINLGGISCGVLDPSDLNINGNGEFQLELVVPNVNKPDEHYIIEAIDDGDKNASADFLVTDITRIELERQFGAPGASLGIMGYNFAAIHGSDVTIKFNGNPIKTLKTNQMGEVVGVFTVPALPSDIYLVEAEQQSYNIEANMTFRVGIMIVILTPITGPTGKLATLTGTGFTSNGTWEANFGGVQIFRDMKVGNDTTFVAYFYIPNVDVGAHTVTILDVDEDIEISTTFTVTSNTSLSLEPQFAPAGFNVSVEGEHFAESNGVIDVEFTIRNSTNDWNMLIFDGAKQVTTDLEGAFRAWWLVPNNLSIGSYYVNATDEEGLSYQLGFEIVSKYLSCSPHRSVYHRGDTVRFNVESSFEEYGSYIMISDPDGTIVWRTDDLNTWIEADVTYVVPLYTQTSGGFPMIFDDEAPIGLWNWTWNDNDDEILLTGSFAVEELIFDDGDSEENITLEVIIGLQQHIDELQEEITQLNIDLANAMLLINNMSSSTTDSIYEFESIIGDVSEDVSESKLEAENAKILAEEAQTSVENIQETADEALNMVNQSKEELDDVKAEAEKALSSSKGLTTMVYLALIASIVSAALTFFGPPQITKKLLGNP